MSDPLNNVYSGLTSLVNHNHYYYYYNSDQSDPSNVNASLSTPESSNQIHSDSSQQISSTNIYQPRSSQPSMRTDSNYMNQNMYLDNLDNIIENSITHILRDITRTSLADIRLQNRNIGAQNTGTDNLDTNISDQNTSTENLDTNVSDQNTSTENLHTNIVDQQLHDNIDDNIGDEIANTDNPSLEISGVNISRVYPSIQVYSNKLSIEDLDKNSNLALFSYNQNYSENHCAICSESFRYNSIIRVIKKCNHIFHQSCVDRWFYNDTLCPICRQDIRTTNSNDNNNANEDIEVTTPSIPTYHINLSNHSGNNTYFDEYEEASDHSSDIIN